MNVLILGAGGREHAMAWKIAQSNHINHLFVAPGNAGTATVAENITIDAGDFESVKEFIEENDIEMLIVGPEAPLVAGISNYLRKDKRLDKLMIIGPSREGAQIEGSKKCAKEFMIRNGIPTAKYKTITAETLPEARSFMATLKPPYVLKADGLAAGKGVLIIDDLDQALDALQEMLDGKFGDAGRKVVIEEFLRGIELSVFVLTDGHDYVILPEAKDYKRIGEGDTGLNTGGMGAVSPVVFADELFMQKVEERIIKPTILGLSKEEIDYKGFIFFGLMNKDNEPYTIEYNARMGDPESEVVFPRINSDLLELFQATYNGKLAQFDLKVSKRYATTVMLVSGGYPEAYAKDYPIAITESPDTILFHAGTRLEGDEILTAGGRVLAVTGLGINKSDALSKSFAAIEKIDFKDKYYRRDIGFDLP